MTNENSMSIPKEQSHGSLPAHDIEEVIGGIFQGVLATDDPVDVHHSFFRIGGTSIMAAKVIARVAAHYQIRLSLRTFFANPTVGDLAKVVESEVLGDVSRLSDAEVVAMTTREK